MLAVLRFVSISDWKIQKKFKNTLWKSRACVPLSNFLLIAWVKWKVSLQNKIFKVAEKVWVSIGSNYILLLFSEMDVILWEKSIKVLVGLPLSQSLR
jgi:hypothetical protein